MQWQPGKGQSCALKEDGDQAGFSPQSAIDPQPDPGSRPSGRSDWQRSPGVGSYWKMRVFGSGIGPEMEKPGPALFPGGLVYPGTGTGGQLHHLWGRGAYRSTRAGRSTREPPRAGPVSSARTYGGQVYPGGRLLLWLAASLGGPVSRQEHRPSPAEASGFSYPISS